jgi:hypothetical protein
VNSFLAATRRACQLREFIRIIPLGVSGVKGKESQGEEGQRDVEEHVPLGENEEKKRCQQHERDYLTDETVFEMWGLHGEMSLPFASEAACRGIRGIARVSGKHLFC